MSDPHTPAAARSLLRRNGAERSRVGMVELFFDLVFVIAITQLSHSLLAHRVAAWEQASLHQSGR